MTTIAEEKEKKEAQRLLELKKQLEDERAIEELRRVQAAAGLITYAHSLSIAVVCSLAVRLSQFDECCAFGLDVSRRTERTVLD